MSIFAGNLSRVQFVEPDYEAREHGDMDAVKTYYATVVQWVVRDGEAWAILNEEGASCFRWLPMHRLELVAAE